jgi:hypothetical protein
MSFGEQRSPARGAATPARGRLMHPSQLAGGWAAEPAGGQWSTGVIAIVRFRLEKPAAAVSWPRQLK